MTDQRLTPDLIHHIQSVLDRHGYTRADDEHTAGPFCSSATWPTSMKAPNPEAGQ
jgi:hypothetical protein